jgi:uncharacterized metal-binding protein
MAKRRPRRKGASASAVAAVAKARSVTTARPAAKATPRVAAKVRRAVAKGFAHEAPPAGGPVAPTAPSPVPGPRGHTVAEPAPAETEPSRSERVTRACSDSDDFGLDISHAKLTLARFAIFAVIAVDAVLQIAHAPRYGAGDFNVAHWLRWSALGPDRVSYAVSQLLISGLAVSVALGVGSRTTTKIATISIAVLYGWCYFGSQLDSYQHHYLVWLIIVLWCFVPIAESSTLRSFQRTPLRSAALRLVLLQLAIMYLYAAISKLDPKWLDGTAMSLQIHGRLREWIDATVGIKIASRVVVVTELALAATVWRVRTWRWAWPMGIGLHGMILFSGLEIGVFAYMMLALYLLMIPESIVHSVVKWWHRRTSTANKHIPALRLVQIALLLFGLVLWITTRLPHSVGVGAVLVAASLWQVSRPSHRHRYAAAAALAATMLLWNFVDRIADVSVDYYRYWGGAARRLGDPAQAERAYRGLLALAPDLEVGRYHLGRLLIRRGALDEGLAELREAERLAPTATRALEEQIKALTAAGREVDAARARDRVSNRRQALATPTHSDEAATREDSE